MVDTVRALATIQNLLADNVAGNISAQDMRDAIISLWVNTVPLWTDVAHVSGQTVRRPDGNVYQANDAIPAATGFTIGTTGATWSLILDGSGLIRGVAENFLVTVDASGNPQASMIEQTGDRIRNLMRVEAPGGGGLQLSNYLATAQGAIVGFEEMASGRMFLPVASELETAGASRPFYIALGAEGQFFSQALTDQTFLGATHQFELVFTSQGTAISIEIQRAVGAATVTDCNLQIRANSFADDNPLIDFKRDHPTGSGFTLQAGTNTITLPVPGFFPADLRTYQTLIAGDGTTDLQLLGSNIETNAGGPSNIQPVPALDILGRQGDTVRLAFQSELRTLEQLQDAVAAMFTGGTHNGISFAYDDTDGFIDATVTGGVPQPGPSITNFSINIPATVNTGTDLNNARTVQFTTVNTSQIASMELVVTTGTNQTLTVPAADGSHSQSVTLAGIDTASAGTITFQIRAVTTGAQTIMSNSQTVTVRAVGADEQAYYGVRAGNDFATVNTNLLTAVDVQPPGTQYTISGSWPATQFIGILEPTDRPITSIVETAFNQETLSTWTRTAAVRTINGQAYDLLTQQNNGPTGTFDFRVTHG